ncbi:MULTISPECIES: alpha/beta hydrolase [unclassified Klebsiella]|uniref:alpha/beta hydrolase n=2 Tax=Klebsiella TaxID=570 RepID=UPI001054B978|nr:MULTISPECIES: alpha/beta hydrolase [unclassified Klebsiella]
MTEKKFTHDGKGILVVVFHAYANNATSLSSVIDAVKKQWPNAQMYCPDLPLSWFSTANPNEIVNLHLNQLDTIIQQSENGTNPITNIILIGHSFGALLARKLYIVACGETRKAPFEACYFRSESSLDNGRLAARYWAKRVSRLILMAGMNRGWSISHHMSITKAPLWTLGVILGHLLYAFKHRPPAILTIRRGAEFITQLRVQWLYMRREYASDSKAGGNAITIQLLGSRDDIVSPDDNIDLISGGDFIYLDVPYSGHKSIIELYDSDYGQSRFSVFIKALILSPSELASDNILPADERVTKADESVTQVAFVIHGIRDAGYWTHKLARRIQVPDNEKWATETSSYGYFPMLPFLFPLYRRKKVEWLMDQYTEALAKYPKASFSYVGHSNGTYLLARALELYPCCTFKNVVFAGSVVRQDFNWHKYLNSSPPRVNAVLNFVATTDWVVAFFSKLFQFAHWQDLGSAGHDGFILSNPHPRIHQLTYIKGGHGAAIEEPLWDHIASFIRNGKLPSKNNIPLSLSRTKWIAITSHFPPIAWILVGAITWGVWLAIKYLIQLLTPLQSQDYATGFSLAIYILILWLLLTKI